MAPSCTTRTYLQLLLGVLVLLSLAASAHMMPTRTRTRTRAGRKPLIKRPASSTKDEMQLIVRSSSNSSSNRGRFPRMGVNHVLDQHSPLRPSDCDDACVSRLRMERLARRFDSSPRQVDAYGPYGQVTTGYKGGGAYSEYYVELSLGVAPGTGTYQPVLMLVDTGSDFPWIQCKPCNPCYPEAFPVYDPVQSTTFSLQVQGDDYCDLVTNLNIGQGADASHCFYATTYGDGSSSAGSVCREQFTFWDKTTGGTISIQNTGFGCGVSNVAGVSTDSSGILGLGYGRGLSWTEQFYVGLQDFPAVFSFCLASIGSAANSGWLVFGDEAFPANYFEQDLVDDGLAVYYYLDIVDILVGGQSVGVPDGTFAINGNDGSGGVIVDSSDMISIIDTAAYTPFRDAWRAAMQPILGDWDHSDTPGPPPLDTCWNYPTVLALPAISFEFSDGTLFTLSNDASGLVYNSNNGNPRMCWPFIEKQAGATPASMVIGSVSLHNTQVIFDIENGIFGWLNNQC